MSEVLGVAAFIAGLAALILTCRLIVHVLRDWAEDRAREAEYADEWCRTHRFLQHERYDHADERRPE